MIVLISPSKSIMKQSPPDGLKFSKILFPEMTRNLVNKLKKLKQEQISDLMNVSSKIAELNYNRFQNWDSATKRPALWMYSGDVYNGIDAYSLTTKNIAYAQEHVRIISGLYGLIRPLDAIQPYRLEMKTDTRKLIGKDLYSYWNNQIATKLQKKNDKVALICASKEYSKVVITNLPDNMTAITPRFMQETDGGFKEKGLFAKYSRGLLARWIIENEISEVQDLRNFNKEGFLYSNKLSNNHEIVYIIPKDFSLKGRFVKK